MNGTRNANLLDYCEQTSCPKIRTKLEDVELWNCTDSNNIDSECALTCQEDYLVYGQG